MSLDFGLNDLDVHEPDVVDDLAENGVSTELQGLGNLALPVFDNHIRMAVQEVAIFVRTARLLVSSSGRDIASQSVQIEAVGSKVSLSATDGGSYLTQNVELLNGEHVMRDRLVVPVEVLANLLPACGAYIVLLHREDGYYCKLFGGDMPIEVYDVPAERYQCSSGFTNPVNVSAMDLFTTLKNLGQIASTSRNPEERYVKECNGSLYVSYAWMVARAPSDFHLSLRMYDVNVLRSLLSGQAGDLVCGHTSETDLDDRGCVRADNFTYWFMRPHVTLSEVYITSMDRVLQGGGVYVDTTHFLRVVQLANALPNLTGRVGLNYTESGELGAWLRTKRQGQSDIYMGVAGTGSLGAATPLLKAISVQSDMLTMLLRSFAGTVQLQVVLSPEGIGIISDCHQAVLFKDADH